MGRLFEFDAGIKFGGCKAAASEPTEKNQLPHDSHACYEFIA
jgi:hypothetical protein